MSQTTQQTFVIPATFGPESDGDCTLVTRDGSVFKVHQVILRLASSVFADMFSVPQGTRVSESGDSPRVEVTEDAETLSNLLAIMYPLALPRIDQVALMVSVSEACDKYFIDRSRVRASVQMSAAIRRDGGQDPQVALKLYALAWKLGLEDDLKLASRYLHGIDLMDPGCISQLQRGGASYSAINMLWDLRSRREQELNRIVDNFPIRATLCEYCGYNAMVGYNQDYEACYKGVITRLRDQLRIGLSLPYPVFTTLVEFLPNYAQIVSCPRGRCRGFSGSFPFAQVEMALRTAVAQYPQEVSRCLSNLLGS